MERETLNEKIDKIIENQTEILNRLKIIEDKIHNIPRYVL